MPSKIKKNKKVAKKSNSIRALSPGDIVDVVSPGSASLKDDVEEAMELLRSWKLKPRISEKTFAAHPFHSNEDEVRLELLQKALNSKDSRAIWCLRGGYGANRLIPALSKMKKPKSQKALIGYSDITSLHILFQQKWNWTVFHGPLLETMISGRLSPNQIEEARRVLFGEVHEQSFQLEPMNPLAKKSKKIQAKLSGGNLVVVQSTIGSVAQLNLKNKILVLEEIGERGYRVDRMLEHLEQANILKGCKAVIFGNFLAGDERDGKNFVKFAIDRFAQKISIPCFSGLEIGHGEQCRLLPLGTLAVLEKNVLKVSSGVK
jgi:muramoyltetrapeptide carboxypeptidase